MAQFAGALQPHPCTESIKVKRDGKAYLEQLIGGKLHSRPNRRRRASDNSLHPLQVIGRSRSRPVAKVPHVRLICALSAPTRLQDG